MDTLYSLDTCPLWQQWEEQKTHFHNNESDEYEERDAVENRLIGDSSKRFRWDFSPLGYIEENASAQRNLSLTGHIKNFAKDFFDYDKAGNDCYSDSSREMVESLKQKYCQRPNFSPVSADYFDNKMSFYLDYCSAEDYKYLGGNSKIFLEKALNLKTLAHDILLDKTPSKFTEDQISSILTIYAIKRLHFSFYDIDTFEKILDFFLRNYASRPLWMIDYLVRIALHHYAIRRITQSYNKFDESLKKFGINDNNELNAKKRNIRKKIKELVVIAAQKKDYDPLELWLNGLLAAKVDGPLEFLMNSSSETKDYRDIKLNNLMNDYTKEAPFFKEFKQDWKDQLSTPLGMSMKMCMNIEAGAEITEEALNTCIRESLEYFGNKIPATFLLYFASKKISYPKELSAINLNFQKDAMSLYKLVLKNKSLIEVPIPLKEQYKKIARASVDSINLAMNQLRYFLNIQKLILPDVLMSYLKTYIRLSIFLDKNKLIFTESLFIDHEFYKSQFIKKCLFLAYLIKKYKIAPMINDNKIQDKKLNKYRAQYIEFQQQALNYLQAKIKWQGCYPWQFRIWGLIAIRVQYLLAKMSQDKNYQLQLGQSAKNLLEDLKKHSADVKNLSAKQQTSLYNKIIQLEYAFNNFIEKNPENKQCKNFSADAIIEKIENLNLNTIF